MWLEHGGLSWGPRSKVAKKRRQSKAARGRAGRESLQGSSFVLPFKLLAAMSSSVSVCSWLCTPSKWTLGDTARSVGYRQIDITLIPSKSGVPVTWLPYHRDRLSKSPLPLDLVLPRTSLWHSNLGTHSYSTQSSFLPHYLHLVPLAMPWSRASCESCSFLFFLTFF